MRLIKLLTLLFVCFVNFDVSEAFMIKKIPNIHLSFIHMCKPHHKLHFISSLEKNHPSNLITKRIGENTKTFSSRSMSIVKLNWLEIDTKLAVFLRARLSVHRWKRKNLAERIGLPSRVIFWKKKSFGSILICPIRSD